MPIIEARRKLTSLPEEFAREDETSAVSITRRGKPVLAVMSWDFYETLMETLEVLGDEALTASVRSSLHEIQHGKGISWERAKKKLGL